MGTIGDDTKPIMKFYEHEQDLVLNKTNANTLIEAFGDESSAWTGRQVQMYSTKVQFGADMVDAIRLTPVAATAPPTGTPPAAVAYGAVPQQVPVQVQPVGYPTGPLVPPNVLG